MSKQTSAEKQLVKNYYDLHGWKKERGSIFTDAARFEDLRPVVNDYRMKCHLRVNRHLIKNGKFILDIASGPVQYPEYLSYSEGYQYRICGDISFTAIQEAKKVVGEKGLYVQCDVTRLPFASHVLDGLVSLHTIYHVPANEQKKALEELYRVLAFDKQAVVVYSFARFSILLKILMLPFNTYKLTRKLGGNLLRALKLKPALPVNKGIEGHGKLYFHPHNYRWFKEQIKPQMDFQLYSWRSVTVSFTRSSIRPKLGGRFFLSLLYRLEDRFPRWFGKNGAYPMIVIKKTAPSATE
jgi:ubiquinone/menaquinone biosynthesis C-methylase UbiE